MVHAWHFVGPPSRLARTSGNADSTVKRSTICRSTREAPCLFLLEKYVFCPPPWLGKFFSVKGRSLISVLRFRISHDCLVEWPKVCF